MRRFITYIKDGEIVASTDNDDFLDAYRLVRGTREQFTGELETRLIGSKTHAFCSFFPSWDSCF